jgi:hypothetical protein
LQSPNKAQTDISSKLSRIQAAFLSRAQIIDKQPTSVLANAVGVLSYSTNNTSGPGGGSYDANTNTGLVNADEQHANVVAALSQHASAAMPVASLVMSPVRSSAPINNNPVPSTSSSAKQFLIRRVRSRSRSDPQSLPDKSLFSRFFPKKTKKPLPTLITTTTKSIDTSNNEHRSKKHSTIHSHFLTTSYQGSNGIGDDEDDDDDFDERMTSTGSLSDTDHRNAQTIHVGGSHSSTVTRSGSRTNSGNGRTTSAGPCALTLPTSDSQYYASMASAPKGFSISYHRCMTKGSDNLLMKATLGRFQQQTQQKIPGGTSQLLVSHRIGERYDRYSRTHR